MGPEHDDADAGTDLGAGTDAGTPGLEQLQHAALEAIRAGRALLDAAEAVVREPGAVDAVVGTLANLARTATEAVSDLAGGARSSRPATPTDGDQSGGGPADGGGVQRIDIS